jgi:hypothetical protein
MSMRGIAAILTAAICALSFAADEKKKKRAEPASVPVRISTLHEGGARLDWLGERIAFGNKRGGTDYWLMNADGSNKRRLTHFNPSGHPDFVERKVIVADLSWRPDGSAFAGYYGEGGPLEQQNRKSKIIRIELR